MCLDIGRIHLQDRIDPNFDGIKFVKKYAEYTELVHLWNVKVEENVSNSHFPALPTLLEEDGWANVELYIRAVNKTNKSYKVLFEHKSHLISDDELHGCYEWVSKLIT